MRNFANVESQIENTTTVLRCQRPGWQRRTLQFFTEVPSFSIYTFGITVLASMTSFEAVDAIRVVVVIANNAVFWASGGILGNFIN